MVLSDRTRNICDIRVAGIQLFSIIPKSDFIKSITFKSGDTDVIFREAESRDVPELTLLEKNVWGEAAANSEQILSRIKVFSAGSWLAEVNGKILGYGVCEYVNGIKDHDFTWSEITDDGFIAKSHKADGEYLYGVNMSVLPEGAELDVPRNFLSCVVIKDLMINGLKGLYLGSRAPGFHDFHAANPDISIEDYITLRDNRGRLRDPMLRFYEELGFQVIRPLPRYFPDKESDDYGVLIMKTSHCFQ